MDESFDAFDTVENSVSNEQEFLKLQAKLKKAKLKKIILIGIAVFILTIIVILSVVLNKSESKQPLPPSFQEFNPYVQEQQQISSEVNLPYNYTTKLQFQHEYLLNEKRILNQKVSDSYFNEQGYYKPVDPREIANNEFNKWATYINYTISITQTRIVRLQIFDDKIGDTRSVGDYLFKRPFESAIERLDQFRFEVQNQPFSFRFHDKINDQQFISTKQRKLLISQKFAEIGFNLPSNITFGLGQHNGQFRLKNGTYTLYSQKWMGLQPEERGMGGTTGSHIHPFLICQVSKNNFMGILFLSAAAQSFEILYLENQQTVLNYITLNGQIEIYFILGGTAWEIVSKYQSLTGRPSLPPYYALGVFQTLQAEQDAIPEKIATVYLDDLKIGLPIQGYHIDNFYDQYQLFDIANDSSYDLTSETLYKNGIHLSLGINSYFGVDSEAKQWFDLDNCTVKFNENSVEGIINATSVNYPEFFDNCSIATFQRGIEKLNQTLKYFDPIIQIKGLQFEDQTNRRSFEPTVPNPNPKYLSLTKEDLIGQDRTYLINQTLLEDSQVYIPFTPGFMNSGYLNTMTIPPSTIRSVSGQNYSVIEFDIHNSNSLQVLKALNQASYQFSYKRPFIMSDATWLGAQSYSCALVTDLERTQLGMNTSLSQAMQLSIFGFTQIMVDSCGTIGNFKEADQELCTRWLQAAAFLPLTRIYYPFKTYDPITQNYTKSEDFLLYKVAKKYQLFIRKALFQKLSISHYVYSQMFYIYKYGGMMVSPLYFEFPEHQEMLEDDNMLGSFMLGKSLMVAPAFSEEYTYECFFPKGTWVNINDMEDIINSQGNYKTLRRGDLTNVYIKEGQIVPYFYQEDYSTITAMKAHQKTSLFINRNKQTKLAEGYIYFDNGNDFSDSQNHQLWKIKMTENSIQFLLDSGNADLELKNNYQQYLHSIIVVDSLDLFENDVAICVSIETSLGIDYKQGQIKNHMSKLHQYVEIIIDKEDENIPFSKLKFIAIDINKHFPFCEMDAPQIQESYQDQLTINATFKDWEQVGTSIAQFKLLDESGTISLYVGPEEEQERVQSLVLLENTFSSIKTINANISQFVKYNYNQDYHFGYKILVQNEIQSLNVPRLKYDLTRKTIIEKVYLESYYLNHKTQDPYKKNFIGLGERTSELFFEFDNQMTLASYVFNQKDSIEDGKLPGKYKNGLQSILIYRIKSTTDIFQAVVTLNPQAQEFLIINNGQGLLEYDMILASNYIHKIYLSNQTIEGLVQKYQNLIGLPKRVPIWAFGYQQCQRGLLNIDMWKDLIDRQINGKIPIDSVCLDIDFLDSFKMFTISKQYKNLKEIIKNYQEQYDLKIIPVITPGIAKIQNIDSYPPLKEGLQKEIFIKAQDQTPLEGQQYGQRVYFPDFLNSNTTEWWDKYLDYLKSQTNFDGLWLIDNEITNECHGYCNETQRPQSDSVLSQVSYTPGGKDLDTNGIGMDGVHSDGQTEFDHHSLYGYHQVKATYNVLNKESAIPFIMSQSNFIGMGKYGHHWIGEYWSRRDYLYYSVQQMYQLGVCGMPFVGVDIWGTYMDPSIPLRQWDDWLIVRWYQLGSFYPYARIYSKQEQIFKEPSQFQNILKSYDYLIDPMKFRYNLIRYYYSSFEEISEVGGIFFKPQAFAYPYESNDETYTNSSNVIMLGNALRLQIQITNPEKEQTLYYFPKGKWCQLYPSATSSLISCLNVIKGKYFPESSKFNDYQLYLREGMIIPYQEASKKNRILSIKGLTSLETNLLINPSNEQNESAYICGYNQSNVTAQGKIYFGDDKNKESKAKFEVYLKRTQILNDEALEIHFCKYLENIEKSQNIWETIDYILIYEEEFQKQPFKTNLFWYRDGKGKLIKDVILEGQDRIKLPIQESIFDIRMIMLYRNQNSNKISE